VKTAVKRSNVRPQGVLRSHHHDEAEEPVGYFRPRPALDQEWFQMPKPPKLAYQREQFFANLLKKNVKGGGGKNRGGASRPGPQPQQQPMTGKDPLAAPKPLNPRRPGGFAGSKLSRVVTEAEQKRGRGSPDAVPQIEKSDLERRGRAPAGGCKRYPIRKVFTPDAEIGSRVQRMLGYNATRRGFKKEESGMSRVGTVLLQLDEEEEEEKAKETNLRSEQNKHWDDLCSLSEMHHRELSMMKNEIRGLRTELERGISRGLDLKKVPEESTHGGE